MFSIFLNTLPFFALIGLGYLSGRSGFFSREATAHLTKFVFYFALSAMLFRFSSNLSLAELLDWNFMAAYLCATLAVYISAGAIARWRGEAVEASIIEAQSSVIGNMGWMGLAMIPILLGADAVGPVMLVLIVDLVFFGPLVVILIVGYREGRVSFNLFRTLGLGLIKNPMVMSIGLGLIWAAFGVACARVTQPLYGNSRRCIHTRCAVRNWRINGLCHGQDCADSKPVVIEQTDHAPLGGRDRFDLGVFTRSLCQCRHDRLRGHACGRKRLHDCQSLRYRHRPSVRRHLDFNSSKRPDYPADYSVVRRVDTISVDRPVVWWIH